MNLSRAFKKDATVRGIVQETSEVLWKTLAFMPKPNEQDWINIAVENRMKTSCTP